jgi:hypothetical protein
VYRTIDAAFWTDPKVKQLPPEGKLLLLYFITNPHTHVSGIYILPAVIIQYETGLSHRVLHRVSTTLSKLGLCSFDAPNDVVWVRRMMSYQGKGEKNLRSAALHVSEDLHNSCLVKEFIEIYPAVKQYLKPPKIDRVSIPYSSFGEVRTPEQEQDIYTSPTKVGGAVVPYSDDFEIFWTAYPRKTGKGAAWQEWLKLKPSQPLQEKILKCIGDACNCLDWKRDNGQYIPHPKTWLHQRRWDDTLSAEKGQRKLVPIC